MYSDDETLVPITIDEQSTSAEEYLNASLVYDDDPRQAAFIACQTPLGTQFAAFWRAVWQQVLNESRYWIMYTDEESITNLMVNKFFISGCESYCESVYSGGISSGFVLARERKRMPCWIWGYFSRPISHLCRYIHFHRLNDSNMMTLQIHLVSEHIWSDDYLVRSFYLKNLKVCPRLNHTDWSLISAGRSDSYDHSVPLR